MKKYDYLLIAALLAAGSVQAFSPDFYFNLAKYQKSSADSAGSSEPVQYGNDGFVTQENRWVSDNAGPHWFEIELAVPMTIGSAHLYSGDTWSSAMLFSDSNWTVTYTRRKIAGLEVYCEWLPSLTIPSWGTNGVVETDIEDDGEIETRTVAFPKDEDTQYLRIGIEQ
jgi:hypothetical protein